MGRHRPKHPRAYLFRSFAEHRLKFGFLEATTTQRVFLVHFRVSLVTGEHEMAGVGDDNNITTIR